MANIFKVVDWLTMEALRILINKAQVAQFFNTDYNSNFQKEFPVGETVRVKLPQRFLVRNGLPYSPQPINRKNTTVTIDQIFGIDFEWDSLEQALQLERGEASIKREYLDPAAAQLANELDSRCALYALQNTNNVVGSLGTTPTTLDPFLLADQRLFENSCPAGEKGMIISPGMQVSAIKASQALFNPSSDISKQYRDGSIGKYGGFDFYRSNNLYVQQSGTQAVAANMKVFAAPANGASSVLVMGGAGDTYNKGDVISFALVNNANPANRRSTGTLKNFVVTQTLTMVGDNSDILNFKPPLAGPGDQYQNVDALPVANAVITLSPGTPTPSGKSGVNGLAIEKDAFALVGVRLETPKAVEFASQTRDPETGLAVRFVRMFDGTQSKMINRFDVVCGFGDLYADNCAVRIASLT